MIGGYVYRGSTYLGLLAQYIFADFCTGRIWRTGYADDEWQTDLVAHENILISTFGQDVNGELYIGSYTADAMNSRVYEVIVPWNGQLKRAHGERTSSQPTE